MPELPEVETVCRGLAENITHRKIVKIQVNRRDLRISIPNDLEKLLVNKTVVEVKRRAKYVLIMLDDEQILIVHLGMSGSLILHEKSPEKLRKHDHVIIEFSSKLIMIFNDARRFGLMTLTNKKDIAENKLFSDLGKEPFDDEMTGKYFYEILQKSKSPIKLAIMDQRKIVGVGNIYACEALFRSKINPERKADMVTKKEAFLLLKNIKEILLEAIESGGSTLRDYVRSSGDAGYFQHNFSVYGKAKQACNICKNPISVIRQSGRSTFFCETCQL
ncbi:MAG: bifunctional DNA-formamidopyrimidine glycosylase/DNA-(apurinic or apyrimidinic site) lyase [Pseudomonadota bacterium]